MKKYLPTYFCKTFPPSSPWKFPALYMQPIIIFLFFSMQISMITLFNKLSTTVVERSNTI